MKDCPECKGVGSSTVHTGAPPWDEEAQHWKEEKCSECDGTGKLSDLKLAIYKARGGPTPPPEHRGFA